MRLEDCFSIFSCELTKKPAVEVIKESANYLKFVKTADISNAILRIKRMIV